MTIAFTWRYSLIVLGLLTSFSSTSATSNNNMSCEKKVYEQDGEEARAIAQTMPYFPFKGIPRFYDIGGFLSKPDVFQQIVDIFSSRYDEIGIDVVAGYVISMPKHVCRNLFFILCLHSTFQTFFVVITKYILK